MKDIKVHYNLRGKKPTKKSHLHRAIIRRHYTDQIPEVTQEELEQTLK